ncbi:MAG TPA: tetratricopeptide repeat protein [Spirochaetota bacterium]|nr:tetratricopeptide repeat protein [Spirochaetota bacterium]HOK92985.1 tetratricopeptide repeat protein [Spirochaetota bacterium]
MKKIIIIFFLIPLLSFFLHCGKKDISEVAEQEFKLSENASVNQEIKKLHEALKTAETDIAKAEIYTKIASIHSEKGDIGSMIKSATEAIKYQPNQYMSHYLLGKSYIAAGRYNDAVDELNIAISLKSDFAPAYFEMGNAEYKRYNYKESKKNFQLAIKYDKNYIDAYNNLGVVCTLSGDLKEAEKNLKICNSLNPEYAIAYKNLGILYDTKMKKNAEAVMNYNKYLTLRPDCPERSLVKLWIAALGG